MLTGLMLLLLGTRVGSNGDGALPRREVPLSILRVLLWWHPTGRLLLLSARPLLL